MISTFYWLVTLNCFNYFVYLYVAFFKYSLKRIMNFVQDQIVTLHNFVVLLMGSKRPSLYFLEVMFLMMLLLFSFFLFNVSWYLVFRVVWSCVYFVLSFSWTVDFRLCFVILTSVWCLFVYFMFFPLFYFSVVATACKNQEN